MRQILISRKIFNTGSIISNGNGSLPVLDCCNSTLHKRDFWFVRNPIVSISVARHHLFADVTLILCCRQISFHFSVPGGCILGEIWTKFWYLYLGSDQHYNLCRLLPPYFSYNFKLSRSSKSMIFSLQLTNGCREIKMFLALLIV